jgi:hypothetical protein
VRRVFAVAALLVLSGACGRDAAPVPRTGAIRGICRLAEAFEPRPFPAFPAMDFPGGQDRVVQGEGRALADCLVFLVQSGGAKAWPEAMREEDRVAWIEVREGTYRPHVQWVREGTQLAFRGGERENNAHGYRVGGDGREGETAFNLALPPGAVASDIESTFLREVGTVRVRNDIVPWASATVHVVGHPYHDLTSAGARPGRAAGEFVLDEVEPGQHDVVCRHEGLAVTPVHVGGKVAAYRFDPDVRIERRVVVRAGETTLADFEIPVPHRR